MKRTNVNDRTRTNDRTNPKERGNWELNQPTGSNRIELNGQPTQQSTNHLGLITELNDDQQQR